LATVFLYELADAVASLTRALGAFDAQHVELALDVTENEVGYAAPCSPLIEREVTSPGAGIFIRREQPKRHAGLKIFQDAGLASYFPAQKFDYLARVQNRLIGRKLQGRTVWRLTSARLADSFY